jgi:hypothetical protein
VFTIHTSSTYKLPSALGSATHVHCTVGWVNFGQNFDFFMRVPLEYMPFYRKQQKKFFLVKWPSKERSFFAGSSTTCIRVQLFFHNTGFMGIKRRRILPRFQKYKLTFVTKCTFKKLVRKNYFQHYMGAPCVHYIRISC